MKHRWRLMAVFVLLLLTGLLLVPQVRWPVYGWVRGEAFYQGMPTSWWNHEVRRIDWDRIVISPAPILAQNSVPAWMPEPIKWLWDPPMYGLDLVLAPSREAIPVLAELMRDEDNTVRRRASLALQLIDPEAAAKAGVK